MLFSVSILLGHRDICSVLFLRATSAFAGMATLPILYEIRSLLHSQTARGHDATFISSMAFLYPISFFYYSLYYTDAFSILSILIVYYLILAKCNSNIVIFFTSIISIFARQTNSVWLMFILGSRILEYLVELGDLSEIQATETSVAAIIIFISSCFRRFFRIIFKFWSLLVPVLCFIFFVIWNQGIVIGIQSYIITTSSNFVNFITLITGDKSNHVPVIHPGMVLHQVIRKIHYRTSRI